MNDGMDMKVRKHPQLWG